MKLDEIRKEIDKIDKEIRTLLMKRLDCSYKVAESKLESGDYSIYRADREEAMLKNLGEGINKDRKLGYLAVVRKITETSRMYQYGLLYDWLEDEFDKLIGEIKIPSEAKKVELVLTRPNIPNAMSSILSMVGDYGYNMDKMELLDYIDNDKYVTFKLVILGNLNEEKMKKLMYQLSKESTDFEIKAVL